MADSTAGGGERLESLTQRERDCLRLVLENHSSKEIARRLGISPASVDTHLGRARLKLAVRDRYAAARQLEAWEHAAAVEPDPDLPPIATGSRGLLPPVAQLGAAARIALVFLCAIGLAMIFGVGLMILRFL